ncbi:MAG: c-type cytochrome [Rhodoferax sp.]|nr:c-type cytochrome [Rhodoferax sp.]
MKFLLIPLLLLCSASQAAEANAAQKAQALAKDSGCLSCHALAEKVVGPSYSSIAEKYKGQPDAAANLAQSIQYGSKGKWGRIPMPAHNALSAEDINALARWVLTVQ